MRIATLCRGVHTSVRSLAWKKTRSRSSCLVHSMEPANGKRIRANGCDMRLQTLLSSKGLNRLERSKQFAAGCWSLPVGSQHAVV